LVYDNQEATCTCLTSNVTKQTTIKQLSFCQQIKPQSSAEY